MLAYFEQEQHDAAQRMGRHHPWSHRESNPAHSYLDFKGLPPEAIAAHLEDLQPIAGSLAAKAVVDFLAWANSPGSVFETNDFGLRPLRDNQSPRISAKRHEMSGRLSIFFRKLDKNLGLKPTMFGQMLERQLHLVDGDFLDGCWGWNLWPHLFSALVQNENSKTHARGDTIQLNLWTWGDDVHETHENLARSLDNLRAALEIVGAKPYFDQDLSDLA